MKAIKLIDVSKRYGGRYVLKNLHLDVDVGEITCIYGGNGVGKTTLIKITAGLIRPSRGEVYLMGLNIRDGGYKKHVGVLLHENVLYEELTIDENLKYFSRMYGYSHYDHISEVTTLMKIFKIDRYINQRVKSLSYGWRKRANIIKTFLNSPDIVLLDEPFIGLDEKAYTNFISFLLENSKDRAIVFTLSNRDDLERVWEQMGNELHIYKLVNGALEKVNL